jgi:DNA polymerase-3 subunit gamma/tau
MYQVIARKYRPQTFAELISQEHVKTTLENAIRQNRIAHGYIFSGQRGTGKTTVARILARCLNCEQGPTVEPCGKCASCLEIAGGSAVDVIEIDAASNRGINEMRELRENVRYRPARDRYKIFILDEAHQITSEAFNALLKTLEEPPEWVVFILCTTEAHKIPATIVSRCQQFSFRSVDFAELVGRMEWIVKQEGIEADAEALSVLAQAGEGSVRDSLSALDQAIACCGNRLVAAEVRTLLGMFSLDSLGEVAKALVASDAKRMFEVVAELESNGRSLQHFARELARYIRNLLVVKIARGETRLVAASAAEQQRIAEVASQFSEEDLTRYLQLTLDLFRDLQSSLQPRLHLEIGLLRLVYAGRLQSIEEALAGIGGSGSPSAGPPKTLPPTPSSSRALAAGGSTSKDSAPALPRSASSVALASAARAVEGSVEPGGPEGTEGREDLREGREDSREGREDLNDTRSRIHRALLDAKLTHVADAVEHSELRESGDELILTTPKMYQLYVKQPEFGATVQRVLGKPVKITVRITEMINNGAKAAEGSPESGPPAPPIDVPTASNDEVTARALAHPEVQRFKEIFPDSQVRKVRNLRE